MKTFAATALMICVTLSTFCPASSVAQGRAPLRLSKLSAESDIVTIGILSGSGPPASGDTSLAITPISLLKGSLSNPGSILLKRTSLLPSDCLWEAPIKSVTGIWFLKSNPDKSYSPLLSSLLNPCFPEDTPFEVDSARDPLLDSRSRHDSVVDAAALTLAAEVYETQGDAPKAFIDDGLFLIDASAAVQSLIYRKWQTSTSDRVRMLGLSGLIALGDANAIQSLANGDQQYRNIKLPTRLLANGDYYPVRVDVLGFDTYEGLVALALTKINEASSSTIDALGAVAQTPALSIKVRREAARPLWICHNQEAAKQLYPLLNSDDPDLRAEAIAGISQYAGTAAARSSNPAGKVSPAVSGMSAISSSLEFSKHSVLGPGQINSTNESGYLDYWMQWSKANLP